MSESGGCAMAPGLVVCAPRGNTFRTVSRCPTCQRRTRHLVTIHVWYGPDVACCACGDRWSDGYRQPRPASRGWREKASRELRAKWRETTTTEREAMAWLMQEVEAYLA